MNSAFTMHEFLYCLHFPDQLICFKHVTTESVTLVLTIVDVVFYIIFQFENKNEAMA